MLALVVDGTECFELRQLPVQAADPHANRRPAEEVLHGPRRDDAAVVDHSHAVADLLHLAQQVRVEEDRGAPLGHLADDAADIVATDGIESRRRLVEEYQLRLAEQRRPKAQALLHAFGKRAHTAAGAIGQAHDVQGSVDGLLPA